jgi:hypothetical protein
MKVDERTMVQSLGVIPEHEGEGAWTWYYVAVRKQLKAEHVTEHMNSESSHSFQ